MKKLSQNPSVSKGETRELLNRITNLQQEKWGLEEQVKHLEESAAAMAQELLEKTKLMQDYVQHTRTGKLDGCKKALLRHVLSQSTI